MISVSAGTRIPWRCARGTRTERLCALRTRRSRSARRPSSAARSSRRSVNARAALSAAVCRAITTQSAASSVTSQKAIQCRPLTATGDLEGAKLRRARARIVGNLRRVGTQRLLRQHAAERVPTAGAYRLTRRADAIARPFAEGVLDDAILSRVVGDHAQPAAGLERITQRGQGGGERIELIVHRNPERLKQTREVGRTGPRSQYRADCVDEIVAHHERRCQPAPRDLLRECATATLVREVGEHGREPLGRPRVEDIAGARHPLPFPPSLSAHSHIQWSAFPKGEPALVAVDLMRADAEVQEDSVGLEGANGSKSGRSGKVTFEVLHPIRADARARGGYRIRVAIDSQDPSSEAQKYLRVAAAPDGCVDRAYTPVRPGPHGRGEDGNVVGNRIRSGRGHAPK